MSLVPRPYNLPSYVSPSKGSLLQGAAPSRPETLPASNGKERDALLQIFRRLDWRFLLPDPELMHVAFLGDDDPQLTMALRRSAQALSLLDLHWKFPQGQEPHFHLVVLRSARLYDADRAYRLVQPGGCLYWEIEYPSSALTRGSLRDQLFPSSGERPVPRSLERLRRHMLQLGFTHVRFHWHRPSFQSAVEIVPLESDGILDFILDGRGARLPGRMKRLAARWLRRFGLLQGLVPCMSVIACKLPCEEKP